MEIKKCSFLDCFGRHGVFLLNPESQEPVKQAMEGDTYSCYLVEIEWEEDLMMEAEVVVEFVRELLMIQYLIYQIEYIDYTALNIIRVLQCLCQLSKDLSNQLLVVL